MAPHQCHPSVRSLFGAQKEALPPPCGPVGWRAGLDTRLHYYGDGYYDYGEAYGDYYDDMWPTYLPACLPTHFPNYLPTYRATYLPTCLLTYLLTYLPT